MKKALLILNGNPPKRETLTRIAKECEFIVVCDGAFDIANGVIEPNLIVGDFDSISKNNIKVLPKNKTVNFSCDKNYTDGYLGMKEILDRGYKDIEILGGFGGRPDHEQYNMILLSICISNGATPVMRGENMDLFITNGILEISTQIGKIISLVPFTDSAHILFTKGLKYSLTNYTMQKTGNLMSDDFIMGVSNIANEEQISVSVKDGLLLVYKEN